MAFANNMALQVDAPNGVVRMVFVDVRASIEMVGAYVEDGAKSEVVGNIAMPVTMAREIAQMLTKALGVPTVEQVAEALRSAEQAG